MSAISWTAIEDAIVAWIQGATGYKDRHVIWNYWKAPRPQLPFVELAFTEFTPIGYDWTVYDDAPDPMPGAELRRRVRGHRTAILTIQLFGATDAGESALHVMAEIIGSQELYDTAIDEAGAGLQDISPARSIEGKRGGVLEPRARCEVTFNLMSELEGRETYIERIQITLNPKTEDGASLGSTTFWVPDPPP